MNRHQLIIQALHQVAQYNLTALSAMNIKNLPNLPSYPDLPRDCWQDYWKPYCFLIQFINYIDQIAAEEGALYGGEDNSLLEGVLYGGGDNSVLKGIPNQVVATDPNNFVINSIFLMSLVPSDISAYSMEIFQKLPPHFLFTLSP